MEILKLKSIYQNGLNSVKKDTIFVFSFSIVLLMTTKESILMNRFDMFSILFRYVFYLVSITLLLKWLSCSCSHEQISNIGERVVALGSADVDDGLFERFHLFFECVLGRGANAEWEVGIVIVVDPDVVEASFFRETAPRGGCQCVGVGHGLGLARFLWLVCGLFDFHGEVVAATVGVRVAEHGGHDGATVFPVLEWGTDRIIFFIYVINHILGRRRRSKVSRPFEFLFIRRFDIQFGANLYLVKCLQLLLVCGTFLITDDTWTTLGRSRGFNLCWRFGWWRAVEGPVLRSGSQLAWCVWASVGNDGFCWSVTARCGSRFSGSLLLRICGGYVACPRSFVLFGGGCWLAGEGSLFGLLRSCCCASQRHRSCDRCERSQRATILSFGQFELIPPVPVWTSRCTGPSWRVPWGCAVYVQFVVYLNGQIGCLRRLQDTLQRLGLSLGDLQLSRANRRRAQSCRQLLADLKLWTWKLNLLCRSWLLDIYLHTIPFQCQRVLWRSLQFKLSLISNVLFYHFDRHFSLNQVMQPVRNPLLDSYNLACFGVGLGCHLIINK